MNVDMKKYSVILADPPWQYRNSGLDSSAEKHYPTMTDVDIFSLPVNDFANENCVLILWSTWPKMQEACLKTITSWGFRYMTGFPWIKVEEIKQDLWDGLKIKTQMGTGFWVLGVSEPILIGVRGKVSPPDLPFAGLLAKNLQHSRKPNDIYKFAEQFNAPYLELFARRKRKGWDSWGNEIESDIDLKLLQKGR